MEIGLSLGSGLDVLKELDEMKELGVTWAKFATSLDPARPDEFADLRPYMEPLREAGIRVVIDTRTTPTLLSEEMRRLVKEHGTDGFDALDGVHSRLGEAVGNLVAFHAEFCSDWEWWGEPNCPLISQMGFTGLDWATLMTVIHPYVRAANPIARWWTGGIGVLCDVNWMKKVLERSCTACGIRLDERLDVCPAPECDGRARAALKDQFDVMNLHHYVHERHSLEWVLNKYAHMFRWVRKAIDENCLGQPIASTEWGMSTWPKVHIEDPSFEGFTSQVFSGGAGALSYEDAPEWFDECLNCFHYHDMKVVMIDKLRDTPRGKGDTHWGVWTGLIKPNGERKPHYEVIQHYAHQGQSESERWEPEIVEKPEEVVA